MAKVYTTDVGTLIKLDTGEELTEGVSTQKIVAKLGEADAVNLTATVVETTKVQHQKTDTTLNSAGAWKLQAHVEFDDGSIYKGDIVTLTIYAPIS